MDRRAFVWGPVFDASLCLSGLSQVDRPHPKVIGTVQGDESVYGVLDMAGSIRKWCAGRYTKQIYWHLVRGAAWSVLEPSNFRVALRVGGESVIVDSIIGFRVARSAWPPR